jgi:ATP/maltotriose-dependent transcriptional regulator MalT
MYGGLELSLALLALVLREQGEYGEATALCDECLSLSRELGDAEGIAIALLSMADLARDHGETWQVRALSEECLARFQELGHPWAIGFSLNNLALVAYLEGDLVQAASRAEESAAIFQGMQSGPSLAEVQVTVGRIKGAQGDGAAARANLAEALNLTCEKGPHIVLVAAVEELGVQAVGQGHAHHGVHLLGAAEAMRQTMGTPVRPADRPAVEGALAAARAALSDIAFAGAWAAGQTLPIEQIVAHALAAPKEVSTLDAAAYQQGAPV